MMTTSQTRVLELALLGLESEKRRIEQELADIRERLGRTSAASERRPTSAESERVLPLQRISSNKGKKMSAAQKKKISQAMKARWASRKRGKAA